MLPWITRGLFCWAQKLYLRVKGMGVKGVSITHKSAFHRAHSMESCGRKGGRKAGLGALERGTKMHCLPCARSGGQALGVSCSSCYSLAAAGGGYLYLVIRKDCLARLCKSLRSSPLVSSGAWIPF